MPLAVFAATPSPHPSPHGTQRPARVDLTKVQPKSLLPKQVEHAEYVVAINKLGQVTRILSQRGSGNPTFDAQTYGNALQAFIRTPDGHVIIGTYRLTYDFDPKTSRVRRDVGLLHPGGVDPNAKGAAIELLNGTRNHPAAPGIIPNAAASVDPRSLPELKGVIGPSPAPSPNPSPH